ncbi:hypothetical protein [Neomesorhizobium albiziae]|uniref:hypothetical protein n=1 Tax=Neomesorhizobium albiziae TaxID=335020 RepID=UPI00122D3B7C|nr:hypothetical protein [Mesorhizobium albiziae]GLS33095.1 hypothetical protein GCM10007937_48060 [Mesorhizobium albiziae]
MKTKRIQSEDFIVIGYEPGSSYTGLGSLLLATAKEGKLCRRRRNRLQQGAGAAMKQMNAIQTSSSAVPKVKSKVRYG